MNHDAYWSVHDCAWARCAAATAPAAEEDLGIRLDAGRPEPVALPEQRVAPTTEPLGR